MGRVSQKLLNARRGSIMPLARCIRRPAPRLIVPSRNAASPVLSFVKTTVTPSESSALPQPDGVAVKPCAGLTFEAVDSWDFESSSSSSDMVPTPVAAALAATGGGRDCCCVSCVKIRGGTVAAMKDISKRLDQLRAASCSKRCVQRPRRQLCTSPVDARHSDLEPSLNANVSSSDICIATSMSSSEKPHTQLAEHYVAEKKPREKYEGALHSSRANTIDAIDCKPCTHPVYRRLDPASVQRLLLVASDVDGDDDVDGVVGISIV